MKDELISWETAKLAKEKGCLINDEKCFNFYNTSKVLIENANVPEKLYPNEYEAISQSLLQRWLREVHNIHVEVLAIRSIDLNVKYVGLVSFIEDNIWKRVYLNKEFNTFEEITEEGLKEGLKLIK